MQRSMMLVCAAALASVPSSGAFAVDNSLRADPFVFVGTAPGCAPTPPGSNIVTSAWLGGMGLPDNGLRQTLKPRLPMILVPP